MPPRGDRLNYCDSSCEHAGRDAGLQPLGHLPGNDGWSTTAPGEVYPNGNTPQGIRNLAGNVAEWARIESETSPDYAGVRGGGWSDPANPSRGWEEFETGYSIELEKTRRGVALGFRCVYPPRDHSAGAR